MAARIPEADRTAPDRSGRLILRELRILGELWILGILLPTLGKLLGILGVLLAGHGKRLSLSRIPRLARPLRTTPPTTLIRRLTHARTPCRSILYARFGRLSSTD